MKDNRELDSKALDSLILKLSKNKSKEQVISILHGLIRHSILYPEPIEKVINTALKTINKQ